MVERDSVPSRTGEVTERLRDAARAVATNSYSPYSGYHVGVAIEAKGEVFLGTNVENVSYPAGVCAERIAMGAAVAAGCSETMTTIVIFGKAEDQAFAGAVPMPCGICLQWMAELAPDIEILVCSDEEITTFRVTDLLTHPFQKSN